MVLLLDGQLVAAVGLCISRVGWVCALALFLLQTRLKPLQDAVQFGKTSDTDRDLHRKRRARRSRLGWRTAIELLCRPVLSCGSFWTSAYIWSFGWLLATGAIYLWADAKLGLGLGGLLDHRLSSILQFGLLAFQLLRRIFECAVVHDFHPSRKMNMLQWFLAVGFYMCTSLSLIFEPSSVTVGPVQVLFSLALFTAGTALQISSHLILARLPCGVDQSGRKYYRVPRGGLFELVSAPHYFAEILIYLAILGVSFNASLLMVFLFVAGNLAMSAETNHRWYQTRFRDYPTNRKRLVPYLW